MKILIYDDNSQELGELSNLLGSLLARRHIQADVKGVSTKQAFAEYLAKENPDLVFMDIYLDDGTMGTELAQELRRGKKDFRLIFVSASNSHAWESYEAGADYYLLKPVTEERLSAALDRLSLLQPGQLITVDTGHRYLSLNVSKILAVEVQDKLCCIHTVSGVIKEYCPLYTFQKLLDYDGFLKLNRSMIINLNHVERLEDDTFIMNDGLQAVIRSREKKTMQALYFDWMFNHI